jgi:segregation and condensation protein B
MSESENIEQLPDETLPDDDSEQAGGPAPDTLRILEAVLFASDELLTTARLKTILPGNPDAREIGKYIERINRALQKERHPFEIVDIGGGYQFKTIAFYHPWVRQIFQEKAAKRLSIQALECLSIIAYRQPLSKAEIETIRGVLSDGAMKTLLEKRLITVVGRSEKPGRPLLYGTTQEFLKYFGLNKIADLPKIEEFEAMVRAKMENLPIEELKQVPTASEQQAETDGATEEASIECAVPADHRQPVAEEMSIETAGSFPQTTGVAVEMPIGEADAPPSDSGNGLRNDDASVFEKQP